MRLIDADELLEKHTCDVYGAYDDSCMVQAVFVPYIKGAPTVDAVPLPCNIGDTAWIIRASNSRLIVKQGVVTEIHIRFGRNPFVVMANVGSGEWGAKVFATAKEAYTALAERKEQK